MNERKRELGYTYETISQKTGVSLPTVQKVLEGIIKSPRYETIKALEKVLGPWKGEMYVPDIGPDKAANRVREPGIAYASDPESASTLTMSHYYPLLPFKNQGKYTAEDGELLPEEIRTALPDFPG